MHDFVGFYSALAYSLKSSVQKMSVMFFLRAFLSRSGSNHDCTTALSLNYNLFGLNDALLQKSNTLLNEYNAIIKANDDLQKRIDLYGPILTKFLQPYEAPQVPGNVNGMITPPYCFSNCLSTISNYASINQINMVNFYSSLDDLLMVGNAVNNYVL